MSFYCREIDHFYSLSKGYELYIQQDLKAGEVKTIPYEKTTDSFSFLLGEEEITCTLGVETKVRTCHSNPIVVNSRIQLRFEDTTSSQKILKLYSIIREFLMFITYRRNIDISEVALYGKTERSDFIRIGTLYYIFDQAANEDEKVIQRTIPYELVKNHINEIFDEISAGMLYIQHIPESKQDGKHITPARFVLETAAFEWNVRNVYTITVSEKQEKVKNDVLEAIKNIPNENSYSRKLKDKYNFFVRLISSIDSNLAGKITHILNDLSSILEPFIKGLYRMNNKEMVSYTQMGERLQTQRNNYAHGNIDKQLDFDVILDIIILEWVNYAMVFKKMGYYEREISKLVNEIFNLNYYIPDEKEYQYNKQLIKSNGS